MKLFFNIVFLFVFSSSIFAQLNNISVSGGIGLGSISGNIPSQTSFGTKISVEAEPFFLPFNSLKLSYTFVQRLEKILPENRTNKYYPFINCFSLTANVQQYLNEYFFVGEGIGIILLNDRTFNDINTWNYGFALDFTAGTELSAKTDLTLNLNYGLTLNNTNVYYLIGLIELKYYLN